jgi:hypothetical protein
LKEKEGTLGLRATSAGKGDQNHFLERDKTLYILIGVGKPGA